MGSRSSRSHFGPASSFRTYAAAAGAGLLLTLAACTDAPAPSVSPSPAARRSPALSRSAAPSSVPAADLSCVDAVDPATELPSDYRLVAGVVGVPTQRVLEASPSGQADPVSKLFAKWGLVVRAGTTVEIAVAPGWERKARVGWGNPGRPATALRVAACPATSTSTGWTAFAGGTWVAAPACVPLTIGAAGQTVKTKLPIGEPCP